MDQNITSAIVNNNQNKFGKALLLIFFSFSFLSSLFSLSFVPFYFSLSSVFYFLLPSFPFSRLSLSNFLLFFLTCSHSNSSKYFGMFHRLKKGQTQNLDLFVVAILNMFLSVFGLPWMHGALPHSPLHLRALADVEERVSQGHVHEVLVLSQSPSSKVYESLTIITIYSLKFSIVIPTALKSEWYNKLDMKTTLKLETIFLEAEPDFFYQKKSVNR